METVPLISAPVIFGPPALFLLGPWLLLVLLLIGPFALLVTFLLALWAVASVLTICVSVIASPYLLIRHLYAHRKPHGRLRRRRRNQISAEPAVMEATHA
jgi:hypothetical protein